ncbi:hypothetical protein PRUB_b0048 [Pseudoalteromonas rubra]|uniref:Uncharacterized protein n=1 Tax=Pseudoalteromonas rubra TaxID=43658 RepID=A0A8T0BYL4_9GAMM|nr:hypothetical protein PRUB_b0048 [Pseudoalteromonas rubra]
MTAAAINEYAMRFIIYSELVATIATVIVIKRTTGWGEPVTDTLLKH